MVSLTNNISRSNVRKRWQDYVAADAKASVSWGTNSKPFSEMPNDRFGGSTASLPSSTGYMSDNDLGSSGGTITASTVRTGMVTGATDWTHMRNMRARRYFDNNGTSELQIDSTAKAYQPTSGTYNARSSVSAPGYSSTVNSGRTISSSEMESYLSSVRTAYRNVRDSALTRDIDTCHYSCHYDCHTSRGRR